jgi:hypothetical protein
VSVDSDAAEKLLAAASQSDDRSTRLVYAAEARICIRRERERLAQQQTLLDALEAEIVRTSSPEQMRLDRGDR